ncbi:MAG: hypothetical protein R3F60_00435 [bacterium]
MAEMIIIEYHEKRLYSPRLGIYVLVFEITCKVTNDLFLLAPADPYGRPADGHPGACPAAGRRRRRLRLRLRPLQLLLHVQPPAPAPGRGGAGGQEPPPGVGLREIAKRVNKFHDRTGQCLIPNHAIQVVSEEHALDRMRYFMGQATAELKSRHPADGSSPAPTRRCCGARSCAAPSSAATAAAEEFTVRLDRLPGLGARPKGTRR